MEILYKKRFIILLVGFVLINISVWIDLLKGKQNIEFGPIQTKILGISILIFFVGICLQFPKQVLRIYKGLSIVFFLVGTGLFCINLLGEFISLRDTEINTTESNHEGKTKNVKYNQDEVFDAIDKRTNEDNEEYAYRLVDLVYNSTLHFFDPSKPEKYHQRVPIYENYIIFFRSLHPSVSDNYEFCNPYKALERGVGLCSQFSKVIFGILEQNGITANIYVLTGHVVTEAVIDETKDQRWVLDADMGVVVEHGVETLESNLDIVQEIYNRFGYSDIVSKKVADIYGSEGNYIQTNDEYCRSEATSYINKWVWPVISMIPFGLFILGEAINNFVYSPNKPGQ